MHLQQISIAGRETIGVARQGGIEQLIVIGIRTSQLTTCNGYPLGDHRELGEENRPRVPTHVGIEFRPAKPRPKLVERLVAEQKGTVCSANLCPIAIHRGSRGHSSENRQPYRPPGRLPVPAVELRRRRSSRRRAQGHPRPRRRPVDQRRVGEQLGQPDPELHGWHCQHQSAWTGRRFHLGTAQRSTTGSVLGADRRRFQFRGPSGPRPDAGRRASRNPEGRRHGHLRVRSRRRGG